ncbi:MAG: hypothetical protein AAGB02_04340 [Pseudomonadota bacterium]
MWRPRSIWLLAAAYGCIYGVFAVCANGLSADIPDFGVFSHQRRVIIGFSIGLLSMLPILIVYLNIRAKNGGFGLSSSMQWPAMLSGAAVLTIAWSTVAAFSLGGVGVIVALLWMRGGVLILSPFMDIISGRRIARASFIALGLSLIAVAIAISARAYSQATVFAFVIASYLVAYSVRLGLMSTRAKAWARGERAAYARDEFIWAGIFAIVALALGAVGDAFSANADVSISINAALVGVLYSLVLFFGTMIYLDPRENTFTIAINRGASLLGGVAGALLAAAFGLVAGPAAIDLVGAGLVLVALAFLAGENTTAR